MFSSEDTWQQKRWQAYVYYQNMPILTFFLFFAIPSLGTAIPPVETKAYGLYWLPLLTLEPWDFSHWLFFLPFLSLVIASARWIWDYGDNLMALFAENTFFEEYLAYSNAQ